MTQVFTIYAAKWVIGKAQNESKEQRDDVVSHFDDKLDSFEGRFSEAYKTDTQSIYSDMSAKLDSQAERVRLTMASQSGVETKALQAYLEKEGGEIEDVMAMAEGQILEQDPQLMLRMALQKAVDAPLSSKFVKENPIKAQIWEMAKVSFASQMEQAFLGTSGIKRKGNVTNPYGL